MSNSLKIHVVWSMLEKITAPLKNITKTSGATARALKETRDRLKELNAQQKTVGEFRELSAGLQRGSTRLKEAQSNVKALAEKLKAVENPTRAMTREFDRAVNRARAIKEANQQQSQQLQVLRDRLAAAGISTGNLGTHERTLRNSIAAANAELARQQQALAGLTRQQERLAAARRRMNETRTQAGNMAMAGVGATAAGAVVAEPVKTSLTEAKHYTTEMQRVRALGLGDKTSADAIKFSKNMKTYGTSATENLHLVRDAMTVFADEHHAEMVAPLLAKMKFANNAMYGEEKGVDNDRKFMDMLKVIELRGGLASEKEFAHQANIVQKVLTATGGRVGPNEWLNVIKTGGVAAKGLKEEAFYYQLEPLVQEMGGHRVGTAMMSAYSNLYQGRTTKRSAKMMDSLGLIGDQSKVTHDKVGQVSYLNPGALLGSDLFRENQFEWMEKVLLPQLAKKGITEKDQVLDTLGSIFSNRTASSLFSQMYLQRDQIHKNAKLNQGAANIDTLHGLAKGTADGQEHEARAKMRDLVLEMGLQVLPLYTGALEMATAAIKSITSFMQEHDTTAKVIIVTLGVLAGLLLIIGPAMLAFASILGPLAVLRFMMAAAGIQGGLLATVMTGLGNVFRFAGTAVLWLGRALLMNPIGLLVTGIAVAALLIYTYWTPIKAFFSGLWIEVRTAFSGGIQGVGALLLNWSPLGLFHRAFAGVLSWFGIELPAKFSEYGANILQGLANGITNALGIVKGAIVNAGGSVIGWFKEKLGIHSPSRIFAELGDFTMQGLALGIDRGQDAPLSQINSLSKRLAQIGTGLAIGTAAMPSIAFDTRAPIAGATAAVYDSHDTVEIHIHAAPGMDPQAIANAVRAELDRRERDKAARMRSSLHDY